MLFKLWFFSFTFKFRKLPESWSQNFARKLPKIRKKFSLAPYEKIKNGKKNFFTCSKKSIFDPNNLVSNKDRNDSLPASLSTLCSLGNLRFSKRNSKNVFVFFQLMFPLIKKFGWRCANVHSETKKVISPPFYW